MDMEHRVMSIVPGGTQIVDLYHAASTTGMLARRVLGTKKEKLHQWAERRRLELDAGRVEAVIKAIGQLSSLPGYNQELCEREIGYFEKNKERMRYAEFRNRGLLLAQGCWKQDAVRSSGSD